MNGYTSFCSEVSQQPTLEDLTAVVLIVGLGICFQSVSGERTLGKANFAGRPFFAYVFDKIVWAGIKSAVIDIEKLANVMSKIIIDNYQRFQWIYHQLGEMGTHGLVVKGNGQFIRWFLADNYEM